MHLVSVKTVRVKDVLMAVNVKLANSDAKKITLNNTTYQT